jgi:hypothetical protein
MKAPMMDSCTDQNQTKQCQKKEKKQTRKKYKTAVISYD